MKRLFVVLFGFIFCGCVEQTGSGLVEFEALAGGPEDAQASAPYEFDSAAGYHVTLTRARLHIGAVYLNRARPILGAQETSCILPGLYAAEIRADVIVDALSPALERFNAPGHGTADRALTGEVWLTGGVIDAANDGTRILEFEGTATRGDARYGFDGVITIGQNRALAATDPATPGANPLCKLRIVTPIPIDVTPAAGGQLVLRVEPRVWFDQVEFARIPGALGAGETLELPDSNSDAVSNSLFQGLRAARGYHIDWVTARGQ